MNYIKIFQNAQTLLVSVGNNYYPKIGEENIKYFVKNSIRNILHADIDIHIIRLYLWFLGDVLKCIAKLQSHCANMTFADKISYDRIFQGVTHKWGESAMNYIKIFQNAQTLLVSVGHNYSDDQLMHIFLDKFHQGRKYSDQISSHQAELRREGKFTDQKSLSISSLKTDYLNFDSSSGSDKNSYRANLVNKNALFGGVLTIL